MSDFDPNNTFKYFNPNFDINNFDPHSWTVDRESRLIEPRTFEEYEQHKNNVLQQYDWSWLGSQGDRLKDAPPIPWERAHIFYSLELIQYEEPQIVSVQTVTVDNSGGGTQNQMSALTYTKASSKGMHEDSTHTWSNTIGSEVDATESLGIPFIEKTTVSIKATYNHTDTHSHTWGDSITTTETISVDDPVTAAPGEIIKGEAILMKQKFAVPYKLWKYTKDYKFGGGNGNRQPKFDPKFEEVGNLVETYGIFRGESKYDLHTKFTKIN